MTQKARRRVLPVEERRQILVQAALDVMKEHGVAGATTRAITSKADMPHGAFRFCFDSKREIYRQVLRLDHESLDRHLSEAISSNQTFAQGVDDAVRSYWNEVTDDPQAQMVFQELTLFALRDDDLRELAADDVDNYVARISEALDVIAEATGTRWQVRTSHLASTVFSLVNGLTLTWLCTRDDDVVAEGLNSVVAMIVRAQA